MRGAFGGYLGSEMKSKADQWARETPDRKNLPEHKGDSKSPKKPRYIMKGDK